ncbi:hypothetical protein J6590_025419 [Homalodisca vitripennis]|nr:hypothetical protein J6590_025419 [Homalodisca vitripennis]
MVTGTKKLRAKWRVTASSADIGDRPRHGQGWRLITYIISEGGLIVERCKHKTQHDLVVQETWERTEEHGASVRYLP